WPRSAGRASASSARTPASSPARTARPRWALKTSPRCAPCPAAPCSRRETPVIYQPGERFDVGGSRVLRAGPDDQVTLVAAGITVHEALAAADLLAEDGIAARVIDAYSIKPIDTFTLRAAARETGRIVTAE